MPKGRAEAFSDGVIAIAITLLVLDIHVPEPEEGGLRLGHELAQQWPSYAAYVVSFATIGIVWMNHHATLRRLRHVDHALLLWNLALLLVIGVVPWSTSLVAAYLREPHGSHLAALAYAGVFLVLTAVFYAMQRHILLGPGGLTIDELEQDQKRYVDRRARVGLIPYAVAMLAGILSAYLTLAICALIAVYYALPTTIYEARRHHEE